MRGKTKMQRFFGEGNNGKTYQLGLKLKQIK